MTEFWSKRQVRTRLGFRTDAELARFFGISRSAVSQWPKDFPIPALRQYILHQRYPGLFPATEATGSESI
ncbi:hypothetical protein I5U42_19720 [Stenotrophomonas maltophilia]|uniref:hypothetical protein n=1 Tax=Stenotrophomonas sp. RAC2 TaxID=3064902 RepID=UPI0013131A12|nr:hypothetical protein [Stenotrophomonas sp. RAC2]MBH1433527.1 hypothetical protein [Stenotrophomonas maltophilia]MDV9042985.1 hypothetical protein [Stenotrophomonas sp. RAC2]